MAEAHVVVICVTVAALALAAAVLGVVGEATTKSKSYVRYDGVNCVYRRTPAFVCGIAGAASLLAGQAIVTGATGCWDRCRTRSDHRRVAVVLSSVLSWFLATMATTAFLVGAFRSESGERRPRDDVASYYRCTVLVAGVFAGASLFAVLAAAVGIASYVALEAAASSAPPRPPCWEERRLGDTTTGQGHRDRGRPAYGSTKTILELFEDEAA